LHEEELAAKDSELDDLEDRVKATIAGRDEALSQLRTRLAAEEKRRMQLEAEIASLAGRT
jgi:hypothetical protein